MWILVVWFICGIFAASIAQSKGYSGCLWLIIGFLFGPLALLGVGFMARRAPEDINPEDFRACPYCQEPVRAGAIKCRHCGSAIKTD